MDMPDGATHEHKGNEFFNPHFIRVVDGMVFARCVSGRGIDRWIPIRTGFGTEWWVDKESQYTELEL